MRMVMPKITVLITGGTGYIGSRVAEDIFKLGEHKVIIFSRGEQQQWKMKSRFPQFTYIIGDTRDKMRIFDAMYNVDYVFHAAALKQVPSCEVNPMEAVKTNVLGSQNVCDAAIACGVKTVVALSTDKAVYPVSAMGLSKAMMEKIVCNMNRVPCYTRFSCIRLGNVIGSSGSVVPLFMRQISELKHLTLTVGDMTRFHLTPKMVSDLALYAMENTSGGEIFAHKAPACTMEALAYAMIVKYSPFGENHPIDITGPRPGEKLHESLVTEGEMKRSTENSLYFCVHPEYAPHSITTTRTGEYTSTNTSQLSHQEILALLQEIECK
jgi:UDP-glucose 4-epimerase